MSAGRAPLAPLRAQAAPLGHLHEQLRLELRARLQLARQVHVARVDRHIDRRQTCRSMRSAVLGLKDYRMYTAILFQELVLSRTHAPSNEHNRC